jgi:hypothetical protein
MPGISLPNREIHSTPPPLSSTPPLDPIVSDLIIPPPLFQPVSHSPIVSHPIILPPLFHPLPCSHCLPSDHSTPSLPPLAPIVSDPIIPPPLLHPLLPLTRERERGDTRREGGGKRKPGAARGQQGTGTLPFAGRITPMYSTIDQGTGKYARYNMGSGGKAEGWGRTWARGNRYTPLCCENYP